METKGPLARILVYVGDVPLGESGRSADGTEMNVGGTVIFTAQGRDGQGNPVAIKPSWRPLKPGIVKIRPSVGAKVTVQGLRAGDGDFVVEAGGVRRTVELIRVR